MRKIGIIKARKDHPCETCDGTIKKGEECFVDYNLAGSSRGPLRQCKRCLEKAGYPLKEFELGSRKWYLRKSNQTETEE